MSALEGIRREITALSETMSRLDQDLHEVKERLTSLERDGGGSTATTTSTASRPTTAPAQAATKPATAKPATTATAKS